MHKYSWQLRSAVIAGLVLYLAACAAWQSTQPSMKKQERGMNFEHGFHAELGLECSDCHDTSSDETLMPTHELCSMCHDIPEEAPTVEECGHCHTDPNFVVIPRESILGEEIIFSHAPHVAAELDCATCHPNPNEGTLAKGPIMANCMQCHAQTNVELNACEVCHTELSLTSVPKFRAGERIPHDSPAVWGLVHGRESIVDPQYCANCHEAEAFCVDCHRTTEPNDHTATWRRSTHGLRAAWDRDKCAVCHEEDSCVKCHRNTKPRSHRGGFGSSRNNHCVQCHFPIEENSCATCHESIEHSTAPSSPHTAGFYPEDCSRCHPVTLGRTPHMNNSTTRCTDCHE